MFVDHLSQSMASNSSSDDDEIHRQSVKFDDAYGSLSADVSEAESSSSTSTFSSEPQQAFLPSSSSSSFIREANSVDDSDFPALRSIMLTVVGGRHVYNPALKPPEKPEQSEIALMKQRFAKLLLGEDMSGGAKGVCTALAISNAITNLSATVFGEMWKLEPLTPQKKSMWRREMEWLLCASDSIVELVPSVKQFPDGGTLEVMVTQPRSDLCVNLPALKKLDVMLISMLDGFHDSEFYYVDRGVVIAGGDNFEAHPLSSHSGRPSIRLEEKWWLPFPKVPPSGLSQDSTKKLLQSREYANQIFKAAVAINDNVLSEMVIPNVYLENLPKNAKYRLGERLYHHLTADQFFTEHVLDHLNLSSEYAIVESMKKIETAVHIWRQKYLKQNLVHAKPKRSAWGGSVKGLGKSEKSKVFAERAETLLCNIKICFPGLPQTTLDMNKIQYNRDVGQSILESYSRVLESLAFNLMERIDDLLYVDDATKKRAAAKSVTRLGQSGLACAQSSRKLVSSNPFSIQLNPSSTQMLRSLKKIHSSTNKSGLHDPFTKN